VRTALPRTVAAALAALLAARAALALPSVHAEWIEVRSAHFTLLGDVKERRLRQVATDLERFRAALDHATGLTLESSRPTRVFVFARQGTFQQYAAGGGTKVTTGYFVTAPDADYIAIDAEDPENAFGILYHEYVHKALAATFPSVPVWLNEGLAEFYSTFRCVGDEVETGRPVRDHVAWLSQHRLLPLETLFAVTERSEEYNEQEKVGVFYAESWALVHMLLRGDPARRDAANAFLSSMLRDEPPEDAARRAFGTGLAELFRELQAYTQRTKFTYAILTLELPSAAVGEAVPLARADLLVRLGDLLYAAQHDRRTAAAEEHYRAALALEPGSARATAGIAKLRADEGKHAEAKALFGAALDRAPDDAGILHYASVHAIEELRATGRLEAATDDDPDLLRARALLERCVAASPEDADTAAMAGFTYLATGAPPARGIELLEAASSRMPRRSDVLFALVALHARSGDREAAERTFARLLPTGSAQEIAAAREEILFLDLDASDEALERGDLSRALELLRSAAERTTDPALVAHIQERVAEIERFAAEKRDRDRYEAVRPLYEAQKWPETRAALEDLLATCTTAEVCALARDVLARIPK
jgi:tetratricopeptide (TPR) repeat protein